MKGGPQTEPSRGEENGDPRARTRFQNSKALWRERLATETALLFSWEEDLDHQEEVTKERASEGFKIQDEAYIEEDRG